MNDVVDEFYVYLLADKPDHDDLAELTATAYARTLRKWLGTHPIDAPNQNDGAILEWVTERLLSESKLSASSRHVYGCAARWWLRFHGVDGAEDWKAPKVKRQRAQVLGRDALSDFELDAMVAALDASALPPAIVAIIKLIPYTGLRIEEVCTLREKEITKHGNKQFILHFAGKGNKTRTVPLSKAARKILTSFRKWTDARETPSEWVFPSSRSGLRPYSPATVRYYLRALRRQLPGYARDVTPHILRHTFATRVLATPGATLKHVQTLLGHASINTTARYLHPSVGDLGDILDQL